RKTDLIRLLANPLIQRSEIADAVRRNCLAFRPSGRDWSDLRSLGGDADVLGSVGACAARGASAAQPAPAPLAPAAPAPVPVSLVAAFLTQRVTAVAGAGATVPVQLKRADGTPARVVTLALRATPRLAAGPPGEVKAVTDDSGFAAFDLPAGRQPGRYRLELIGGSGAPLPGRPASSRGACGERRSPRSPPCSRRRGGAPSRLRRSSPRPPCRSSTPASSPAPCNGGSPAPGSPMP